VIEQCQYLALIEDVTGLGELGRLGELVHRRGRRRVVARPRRPALGLRADTVNRRPFGGRGRRKEAAWATTRQPSDAAPAASPGARRRSGTCRGRPHGCAFGTSKTYLLSRTLLLLFLL
jgi:hypothetical protein